MKITGKTIIGFFIVIIGCFVAGLNIMPVESHGALATVSLITLLTAMVSFLFGLITGDYSWTDRLWSTTPVAYAWIYAYGGAWSFSSVVGALLVTLWGARLTFNFARRGGYTGGEDYRWPILRDRIGNPVLWQLFNLLFIACYQQFLFICFTVPLYIVASVHSGANSAITATGVLLALFFLLFETIADQQQYDFQQAKYGLRSRDESLEADYRRGFRTTGLFAISRHPNYLGELGVWWSMFIMSVGHTGVAIHWSIIGPLLLTLLFIGSTKFTEAITARKYPQYAEYQERVWPIFPKLKRPGKDAIGESV